VILDLGPIPWHARRAFADDHGIFFGLTQDPEHARAREQSEERAGARQVASPEERQAGGAAVGVPAYAARPRGFVVAPVQVALAAVLVGAALLLSGLASLREDAMPRAGESPAPLAGPAPAGSTVSKTARARFDTSGARLLSTVDRLVAQAEALEARRASRLPLSAECVPGCAIGVDRVTVRRNGDVSCRCVRIDVGVYRIPSVMAREPEELGQRQVRVDEPGARGTDTAGAGLAFSGGPRS
jgi:hypothetical protein